VMDVVLMGRLKSARGWIGHSRADRAAAEHELNRLGMLGFRNRRIGALSGGQRQRVFIARALISEPEILFLDEPTASVDAWGQTEFYDLLKKLNQTVTIVMVSHDFMAVSSHVRSIACVNREVHFHSASNVTSEQIEKYCCPVDLMAHRFPHTIM